MLTNLALDRGDSRLDVVDRPSCSAHSFPSFSKRLSSPPAVSLGSRDFAPAGLAWVIQAPGTSEFQTFLFLSREISSMLTGTSVIFSPTKALLFATWCTR